MNYINYANDRSSVCQTERYVRLAVTRSVSYLLNFVPSSAKICEKGNKPPAPARTCVQPEKNYRRKNSTVTFYTADIVFLGLDSDNNYGQELSEPRVGNYGYLFESGNISRAFNVNDRARTSQMI